MEIFDDIVIRYVEQPFVVQAKKGHTFTMIDRPTFAISFCISGQITYAQNGKEFVIKEGYAALLPKDSTYSLIANREGQFPVVNFDCDGLVCDEISLIPLTNNKECIKRFERLKLLFSRSESRLKTIGGFYNLLDEVVSTESKISPIHSVDRYIEKNLSDPELSNETIAGELKISEVYLRKLFTNHLGTSPKQYILDMRIQKAKELLIESPLSVTDISRECGFSSVYHFCRAFKQRTATTPTQFAEKNRIFRI